MRPLINKLYQAPKAELHLHIEGTLEPELIFALAIRNGIHLPYPTIEALRSAYQFSDLQSFLDVYYAGTRVLITEDDFYDMTSAYINKALADNVIHAEIFFDPQSHLVRGVSLAVMLSGMEKALAEAEQRGFSSKLIMCFLRHLPESDALSVLIEALPFFDKYAHRLIGIGLDSSEKGNPPSKFTQLFALARQRGLHCVAHAGEEGPADYVAQAINLLAVERIDHGIRSIDDPCLLEQLAKKEIPLTVCPLSNLKLKTVKKMSDHPLRILIENGVKITINSDDPAYFGGYINDNYLAIADAFNLSEQDFYQLLQNSFSSAFITVSQCGNFLEKLRNYWVNN